MKQLLLATTLILVPVAVFTGFTLYQGPATASTPAATATTPAAGLGDMSAFKAIIADVQTVAATGDFAAAQKRITDFETAWDDAASKLRALNGAAWGNVDDASDAALGALRAGTPVAGDVTTTLAALMAELENPDHGAGTAATGAIAKVSGIAVTDANGRALPCEVMIGALKSALASSVAPDATKASATDFQSKALERCNADDDARADGFSAQGLALLTASN